MKNHGSDPPPFVDAHRPTSSEVRSYLPLVSDIASGYSRRLPRSVPRGDLLAAGAAGVFDALRKRGLEPGPGFEGYVRTRIRGAIIDELRTQDWLSRRARKQTTAWATNGTGPGGNAVVRLDDLPEEVSGALTDVRRSPVEELRLRRDSATLASAVASLPPRERVVVTLHYLEDVQLTVVAAELGVSVARACQLRSRAIDTLRSTLSSGQLEAIPSEEEVPAKLAPRRDRRRRVLR